ncbi:MAG: DUF898 family protein [Paracoccaceae bacterium]
MTDATLHTEFAGRRGRLFGLALGSSLLTVLTLGLYRFWMKTRLRRYYWSSIRPGGIPLEYTGLPSEKLLGFLIAVVIVAFYIGVVNLVLMFASFALLHGNVTAYALSFVGVVPLWFYARYRARRYVLARTRWRGIRFGLEPGAWGYALRALWHWALTVVTLGLLWPRKTFWLEKYITDRTWFGTQPLVQTGRWTMLLRPFLPVVLGVLASLGLALGGGLGDAALLFGLFVTVPFTFWALVHYRVTAFRLLTEAKRAGALRLVAAPRTGRVLRIYALGWLGIGILTGLVALGFFIAVGIFTEAAFEEGAAPADPAAILAELPAWTAAAAAVGLYFAGFVMFGVLTHVFLTLPLLRHYAETLTVQGAPALSGIAQRGRDAFAEAEGFAEALDVGAAI